MSIISRFTRYTTQKEPVLSVGVLAAIVLAVISRFVTLTEDDLQLLGLLLVPIVTAAVARLKAWSPASVQKLADQRYDEGTADATARLAVAPEVQAAAPRPVRTAPRPRRARAVE